MFWMNDVERSSKTYRAQPRFYKLYYFIIVELMVSFLMHFVLLFLKPTLNDCN